MTEILMGTNVLSRDDTEKPARAEQENPWACSWDGDRGGEALSAPCPKAALGNDLWSLTLILTLTLTFWSPGGDVNNENPPLCGHLMQQMWIRRWGVPVMLQLPRVGCGRTRPRSRALLCCRGHGGTRLSVLGSTSRHCLCRVPLSPPRCQGQQESRSARGDANRKGHRRLLPAQETCLFIFFPPPDSCTCYNRSSKRESLAAFVAEQAQGAGLLFLGPAGLMWRCARSRRLRGFSRRGDAGAARRLGFDSSCLFPCCSLPLLPPAAQSSPPRSPSSRVLLAQRQPKAFASSVSSLDANSTGGGNLCTNKWSLVRQFLFS